MNRHAHTNNPARPRQWEAMLKTRIGRARGHTTILSALLMTSALTGAALAQDDSPISGGEGKEEVTVTAQRGGRAESVQKVPIAVTAMSQKELEARAIESFKDLQFNVPSVTYSNGNFDGNNFQIRGIGISSVATSADSGVSVHTNDVYVFGTAGLATAEYYDLERIEVLRGPQSTLYGRNATGGVVNVITAKPVMDDLFASGEITYGEHETIKGTAVVNLPLAENILALRLAYNYAHHDGYVKNLFDGNNINSQNLQQVRASLRFTPTEKTTIDLIGAYSFEKDSRMRYPKQLCDRDPSNVVGCLPNSRGYEPVNSFSTFGTVISSTQTLSPLFGLFNVLAPGGGNGASPVPRDNLEVYTDFTPFFKGNSTFLMASVEQEITPWLTANLLLNYGDGESYSQSHYNNLVGDSISARLQTVANNLTAVFGPIGTAYVNTFFRKPDGTLGLPVSIPGTGGVTAGPVEGETVYYADKVLGFDEITGAGEQFTAELRFTSSFDGPVNFMIAGFYIDSTSSAKYSVNSNLLDFAGIMLGLITPGTGYAARLAGGYTGPLLVFSPTQFTSDTRINTLESTAFFGEVYWDITDELKLTGGLRYLEDEKRVVAQTTLFNYMAPLGTPVTGGDALLTCCSTFDADPSVPGRQIVQDQTANFDAWTGRVVLEWTPDTSWSDSTLVYASYSRGFKSGGLNPPVSAGLFAVPLTFDPEIIDAFEIGTKNRFMDNQLTVNLTGYYYDYAGYQIADIIARTAVNSNIDATIWGLEAEFLYRPDDNWQFNLTVSNTNTEIGTAALVDQRNPTAGRSDAILVKDLGNGANCVIVMSALAGGVTPGQAGVPALATPAGTIPAYAVPPGGAQQLAGEGIANVNFGSCSDPRLTPGNPFYSPTLGARYSYAPDGSGLRTDITGNELPQQPNLTVAFGAQYTLPLDNGMEVVFRGDYYWQDEMWTRIINGPADLVDAWDVLNLSVQLNAPEAGWYAKVFATNVLDSRELTGAYLTDASSGLFTNIFVQDPRVIGITFGVTL